MEILRINLSPRYSECCICGVELVDCRQGIPMYENEPVPHDWEGPWAGVDACKGCYEAYEQSQRERSPQ